VTRSTRIENHDIRAAAASVFNRESKSTPVQVPTRQADRRQTRMSHQVLHWQHPVTGTLAGWQAAAAAAEATRTRAHWQAASDRDRYSGARGAARGLGARAGRRRCGRGIRVQLGLESEPRNDSVMIMPVIPGPGSPARRCLRLGLGVTGSHCASPG
jgi:hypothetical protein